MQKRRTYVFPNAFIHVLADRTCREQPKWCMSIMVKRDRRYVAEALLELRNYRRMNTAESHLKEGAHGPEVHPQ